MNAHNILTELEALASPSIKKTLLRHGAVEPFFGVKIGDLKPLVKKLKGCQELAMDLYATGNSDAMYLAGLVASGSKMSVAQLEGWAAGATWHMLAGSTVAWVAVEHPEGVALAQKWIQSENPLIAVAGWSTLSSAAVVIPDEKLPIKAFSTLLKALPKELLKAPNRVRYTMNHFVICVGTYVVPLADQAMEVANKIGKVAVDMGDTECQVPEAAPYILKCLKNGACAPKRKTVRC